MEPHGKVRPAPSCVSASCSLVEAYLRPTGPVNVGCPTAKPSATPQVSSFSPQLVLAAQAAVQAPWRLPNVGRRSTSRASAAALLEGTWSPPPVRHPISTGPSANPSEALAPLAANCVRRVRFSTPRPGSCATERRAVGSSQCGSTASSCADDLVERCCGGSVAGGSAAITHATTPSWRSRSFPQPPRARTCHGRKNKGSQGSECSIEEEADATDGCAAKRKLERHRLPPLPMEARWAHSELHRCKAPPSEVQRLQRIDEHVREANAMLVESFLKIKRQPLLDDPDGTSEPEQSCADSVTASSYL